LSKLNETGCEGWHRADIMAAVRKGGSSLAGIGREAGLARATMVWALVRPHERANRAIAEFLDVPLHDLWPQWFDADGKLISRRPHPRPRVKPMTTRGYVSCHPRAAA